jgi:hypothetical protein
MSIRCRNDRRKHTSSGQPETHNHHTLEQRQVCVAATKSVRGRTSTASHHRQDHHLAPPAPPLHVTYTAAKKNT